MTENVFRRCNTRPWPRRQESYVAYFQDIPGLCQKLDAASTEEIKVVHILEEIADDVFQLLVIRDFQIVTDVIADCSRFQEAKSCRITHSLTRLPNTAST